jgi:ABC-2 type transport system ATP-binding protein
MELALIVNDVTKKFGKPGDPFWKRLPFLKTSQSEVKNGNGNGGTTKVAESSDIAVHPSGKANNGNKKEIVAVDHVSFEVKKGEIFGVLGPNGGGKSTLIRLMSTLLLPDSGQILVFGEDVVRKPMAVQPLINRVSVEASFFKKLSPLENLLYGARLYGMSGKETRKQIIEILTRLGLEKRSIYNPMEEMSRGMQQKVAIARALLSHPRLLLLDEPTTGLDPRSKREVQAVVRELQEKHGTTILLTTHDMVEAENLCGRVAIMDSGKIVALDTPEGLKKLVKNENGSETTLEDVFLALTGKKLANQEEEEAK